MHLGSWRQRILIILGLLLVIVPVIGLPILIKNILVAAAGLFLITLILTTSDHEQVVVDQQVEVVEKTVEAPLPSVYHEQVPEFYIEPEVPQKFSRSLLAEKPHTDLVPSPLKTKTVRRRTTKTTKVKQIEDHASVV